MSDATLLTQAGINLTVSRTDTTTAPYLSTTETGISSSTSYPPTYGTETSSADVDTTPVQVTISSVAFSDSNTTTFSSTEQTTVITSTPRLTEHGTLAFSASGDGGGHSSQPGFSVVSVTSVDTTLSLTTEEKSVCASSQCHIIDTTDIDITPQDTASSETASNVPSTTNTTREEMNISSESMRSVSADVTEMPVTGTDTITTAYPAVKTKVQSPSVSSVDTTPGPATEETSMAVVTPYLSTFGADGSSTVSDATLLTQAGSNLTVSRTDTTTAPYLSTTETGISSSTAHPPTYGTETSSADTDTSPRRSTQEADSNTTPHPLTEQTTMITSTALLQPVTNDNSVSNVDSTLSALVQVTNMSATALSLSTNEEHVSLTDADARLSLHESTQAAISSLTSVTVGVKPYLSTNRSISDSISYRSTSGTDLSSTGTDGTPRPTIPEVGSEPVEFTDTTLHPETEEETVSTTTSSQSATEKYFTGIDTATTPCLSSQAMTTNISPSSTSCLFICDTDVSFTGTYVSTISYHSATTTDPATLGGTETTPQDTGIFTSTPCLSACGKTDSTPYPLTTGTDTSSTDTTPCLSTDIITVSPGSTPYPPTLGTDVSLTDTTPCLSTDETTVSPDSTPCALTLGTDTSSTDTTPCLSTGQTIVSPDRTPCPSTLGTDVSSTDTTSYLSTEQTAVSPDRTPCPSTLGTDVSSTDTTPCLFTDETTVSPDSTPCPLTLGTNVSSTDATSYLSTEQTTVSPDSTPCPSTLGTDTSSTDTTPCLSPEQTTVSPDSTPCPSTLGTDVSSTDTTPCLSTEQTTVSPSSTACFSTNGAGVSSSIGDVITTAHPAETSSEAVSHYDTTPHLSVDDSTSTPCPSTYRIEPSLTDNNIDATFAYDSGNSVTHSEIDTTSYVLVRETSISASPQYPSTHRIVASLTGADYMPSLHPSPDIFAHSRSNTQIPLLSTQVLDDSVTTVASYPTAYPTGELIAMFSSVTHQSTGVSDVSSSLSAQTSTDVDNVSHVAVSSDVPFSATDDVSKLQTAIRYSASATESETVTKASSTLHHPADIIAATSDNYALSSHSVGVPSSVSVDYSGLSPTRHDATTTLVVSPVVSTSSETLLKHSAGTDAPIVSLQSSDADPTVEAKQAMSTGVTYALVTTSEIPYTSTEVYVTSHSVNTTVPSGVDITSSDDQLTTVNVSLTDDNRHMSTAVTSAVVDFLPGDFKVQ